MMLVSKDLKKCLAVMTLGATLMTGCTSGPGTGFTRFWPKKDNEAAVAQDEELAAKWRARIEAKSEEEIISQRDQAAREKTEAEPKEKSRFGFLRFPWNKDKQPEPQAQDDVQKLEERLAQLESEKRRLMQERGLEQSSLNRTKRGVMEDPFLKAEQQTPTRSPLESYARTNNASANRSTTPPASGLPKWAQESAPSMDKAHNPTIASTSPPVSKNEFTPGFDETLKNLGTEVERETASQAAPFPAETKISNLTPTAPAMPDTNLATRTGLPNQNVQALQPELPKQPEVQPKLDQPIAVEAEPQHPLANVKTVAEQRHDWATLEVQQLMKHARIQARANQFEDAIQTALAAEQLSNNASLKFAANEQTPAELIMILKYHIEQLESSSAVAAREQEKVSPVGVAQVSVPAQTQAETKLPNWPYSNNLPPAATREVAAAPKAIVKPAEKRAVPQPKPSAPETSVASNPPQWPAPKVSLIASDEPKGRYIEARPGVSTHAKTQLITSSSIYSSENLRWAKLESERATLKDSIDDQTPIERLSPQGLPPVPEADEDDPFAAAFGSSDAEEEALIEEVPEALLAPEIPAEGEPMVSAWDDEVLGIPVRRIALLALAGLILLAAIIHRRRNNPEQI